MKTRYKFWSLIIGIIIFLLLYFFGKFILFISSILIPLGIVFYLIISFIEYLDDDMGSAFGEYNLFVLIDKLNKWLDKFDKNE